MIVDAITIHETLERPSVTLATSNILSALLLGSEAVVRSCAAFLTLLEPPPPSASPRCRILHERETASIAEDETRTTPS